VKLLESILQEDYLHQVTIILVLMTKGLINDNKIFLSLSRYLQQISVAREIHAASAGDFFFMLRLFDWFVGSRHLVIDCGLLGNRMYWSCQRFAGKGLVVVREGISTPNAPYLR
jgi:hypothetical protein